MQRIYFAHLHKAGGTSACVSAHLNGWQPVLHNKNCNPPEGRQRETLNNGSIVEQCRILSRLANRTFVANEQHLPDHMYFARTYTYATILRDPAARYASQYLHIRDALRHGTMVGEYAHSAELMRAYPNPRRTQPPLDAFLRHSMSTGFKDNYLVRFFAGASAMRKPEGGLDSSDVTRAMCRLLRFNVVLTLDDADLMQRGLGFARVVRTGTHHDTQAVLQAQPNSTHDLLRAKSSLDNLLYRYAREIVRKQRGTPRWPLERANASAWMLEQVTAQDCDQTLGARGSLDSSFDEEHGSCHPE